MAVAARSRRRGCAAALVASARPQARRDCFQSCPRFLSAPLALSSCAAWSRRRQDCPFCHCVSASFGRSG
eukprot:6890812-Pyramimonas_sp.AAC.2